MSPGDPDAAAAPALGGGADLRETIVTLWRGKWAVLGAAALAALAAAVIASRVPPVYEATAKVLLETRAERVADIQEVVGALAVDNAVVASEIAVIRSEAVIGAAVDRLGLADLPAFGAPAPGLHARLRAEAESLIPPLQDWLPPQPPPASPDDEARERLAAALGVYQEGRSYVIAISVRAGDARLAAAAANEIATIYVERQVAAKRAATARAAGWLAERIDALKAEVSDADAAVEQFRAGQSLGEGQGGAVTARQLDGVGRELVAARADRAAAESRRDRIVELAAASGREAAADVLSSPLILSLRQQRAEVARREAELSARYGPKHPKIANVRAELDDLSDAIGAEVTKLIAGLKNDAAIALARERALAVELAGLEERSVDLSRASVGLRQLEREAEASRRIYETLLGRWKETTEARDLEQPDARVISEARPPRRAASPRTGAITALAGLGGGFAGLALVFIGELMANTFRTGAEAERLLGRPLLARLPRLRGARRRRAVLEALESAPNSAFAEAARTLRNALLPTAPGGPGRVVLTTSAAPGEGKTATCLALAHMCALMGKRAVVVECDFRRPQILRATGLAAEGPDLTAVLRGEAALADALVPVGLEGACALPVAAPTARAADLLSSPAFAETVAALAARFDLVLLDTPPALAVPDAVAAARTADATLFLVRWNATPRQASMECLRRLEAAGPPLLGVALTLVDPRREAAYEYSGYRTGAPDYAAYYG